MNKQRGWACILSRAGPASTIVVDRMKPVGRHTMPLTVSTGALALPLGAGADPQEVSSTAWGFQLSVWGIPELLVSLWLHLNWHPIPYSAQLLTRAYKVVVNIWNMGPNPGLSRAQGHGGQGCLLATLLLLASCIKY